MIQKTSPRKRRHAAGAPSTAQIAQERSSIQASWSPKEKQHRRVDGRHGRSDSRLQAQLRFIRFLVELDAAHG